MDGELINLIVFLLIGLAAGYVAGLILKGRRPFGLIGDMILGIVGAFVGGWLLGAIGIALPGGLIGSFVVALIGAVIILFVVRLIRRA